MRRKFSIFDTLGVRTSDDLGTIRQAWRHKVKMLHPDLAADQDKPAASEALVTVNAAFEALRDHTPFAERRRSDRRASGNRGRVWTKAERQSAALKQAQARREKRAQDAARAAPRPTPTPEKKWKVGFLAAREHAKQAEIARRNAAALAQREDAARAARAAKRAHAAQELRDRTARKNAEAARTSSSTAANATKAQKAASAALRGYADSLNVVSANGSTLRCQTFALA